MKILIASLIISSIILSFGVVADENALEFKRIAAPDGGSVQALQRVYVDVSDASSIIIKADVKVIDYNLVGTGWWYEVYPGPGDYPVKFIIFYLDQNNEKQVYGHGFLDSVNPFSKTNYHIVERNKWASVEIDVLEEIDSKPKCLGVFATGGSGWSFHGMIDNIELLVDGKNVLSNGDFSEHFKDWMLHHRSNIQDEFEIIVTNLGYDEGNRTGIMMDDQELQLLRNEIYGEEIPECKELEEFVEELPSSIPEVIEKPIVKINEPEEEPEEIIEEPEEVVENETIEENMTENATTVLELIGEDQLKITPEVLKVNPGILTAYINFPAPYNDGEITNAICDYASYDKIAGNNVKFKREDIENALEERNETLDIHFEVWGTLLYDGEEIEFYGSDNITRIEEKTKAKENYEKIEKEIQKSKDIVYTIQWIIGQKEEEELRESEILENYSEDLEKAAVKIEEMPDKTGRSDLKSKSIEKAKELRVKAQNISKKAKQKKDNAKGPIISLISNLSR